MARRTSPRVTTSILAMIGECTGNVRSTPTPKLTLRTVNVSRHAAALAADDDALEHLDPLAGAFDDADVHLQGVAGRELGDVVAQLGAVDEIGGVHRASGSGGGARAERHA